MTIVELAELLQKEIKAQGIPQYRVLYRAHLDSNFFSNVRRNKGMLLESLLSVCGVLNLHLLVEDRPITSLETAFAILEQKRIEHNLSVKELTFRAGYNPQHLRMSQRIGSMKLQALINYFQVLKLEMELGRPHYEKLL